MIALKDNSPYFTPEEYFAWEEQQLDFAINTLMAKSMR